MTTKMDGRETTWRLLAMCNEKLDEGESVGGEEKVGKE